MKNLVLSAIAILTLVFIGTSCSSDDNNSSEIIIQASELPIKAKTFLDNVFTNIDITREKKKQNLLTNITKYILREEFILILIKQVNGQKLTEIIRLSQQDLSIRIS